MGGSSHAGSSRADGSGGYSGPSSNRKLWLPDEIAKVVLAPRHLNVSLTNPSPDRKYFLKAQSEGMPTMAVFAKPHYYLGGVQVVDDDGDVLTTLSHRHHEVLDGDPLGDDLFVQAAGHVVQRAHDRLQGHAHQPAGPALLPGPRRRALQDRARARALALFHAA